LFAEDVAVSENRSRVGTPFYVYSTRHAFAPLQGVFDDALRRAWHHLVASAMNGEFKPGRF